VTHLARCSSCGSVSRGFPVHRTVGSLPPDSFGPGRAATSPRFTPSLGREPYLEEKWPHQLYETDDSS